MRPSTLHNIIMSLSQTQVTLLVILIDGTTYDYDSLTLISLVEEGPGGEIKILNCKDFSDPHKRGAFYAGIAKVAQGMPAS